MKALLGIPAVVLLLIFLWSLFMLIAGNVGPVSCEGMEGETLAACLDLNYN